MWTLRILLPYCARKTTWTKPQSTRVTNILTALVSVKIQDLSSRASGHIPRKCWIHSINMAISPRSSKRKVFLRHRVPSTALLASRIAPLRTSKDPDRSICQLSTRTDQASPVTIKSTKQIRVLQLLPTTLMVEISEEKVARQRPKQRKNTQLWSRSSQPSRVKTPTCEWLQSQDLSYMAAFRAIRTSRSRTKLHHFRQYRSKSRTAPIWEKFPASQPVFSVKTQEAYCRKRLRPRWTQDRVVKSLHRVSTLDSKESLLRWRPLMSQVRRESSTSSHSIRSIKSYPCPFTKRTL